MKEITRSWKDEYGEGKPEQCWPMRTIDAICRCFLSMAYGVTGLEVK